MTREYYDLGHTEKKLSSPTNPEQDTYWMFRSDLTRAIAKDWQAVTDASPAIRVAAENLHTYVQSHPTRGFRIFRPEDADSQHSASLARAPFLR